MEISFPFTLSNSSRPFHQNLNVNAVFLLWKLTGIKCGAVLMTEVLRCLCLHCCIYKNLPSPGNKIHYEKGKKTSNVY